MQRSVTSRLGMLVVLVVATGCLRALAEPDAWPCDTPGDCEAGEQCVLGRCRAAAACTPGVDCGEPDPCANGGCTSDQCTPGLDARCSPYPCIAGGVCGTSCTSGAGCAPGYRCVDGACLSDACSDASAEFTCGGYACISGQCEEDCQRSHLCSGNRVCLNDGVCALTDGQRCDGSERCAGQCCSDSQGVSGTCAPTCGTLPVGSPCTYAVECVFGSCIFGQCDPCSSTECQVVACAGIECGSSSPSGGVDCGACSGGLVCRAGQCTEPCDGAECGVVEGVSCGVCADGFVCVDNTCAEKSCEPGSYGCEFDDLYYCERGTSYEIFDVCLAPYEYCKVGEGACQAFSCSPGKGMCDGDLHYACDEQARRTEGLPRDCKKEGRVCNPMGCVLEHTDEIGTIDPTEVTDPIACGNVYFVEHTVTLTGVTLPLGSSGAPEGYWFVFVADPVDGVFSGWASPTLGSLNYAEATQRSPELAIELPGGFYYFIGLQIPSGNFLLDASAQVPQDLSFGRLMHGACSPGTVELTLTDLGVVPGTISTFSAE